LKQKTPDSDAGNPLPLGRGGGQYKPEDFSRDTKEYLARLNRFQRQSKGSQVALEIRRARISLGKVLKDLPEQ
jgi:hypothetical protein